MRHRSPSARWPSGPATRSPSAGSPSLRKPSHRPTDLALTSRLVAGLRIHDILVRILIRIRGSRLISKDKMSKNKSQNSRHQDFAYYFCLMREGSGSRGPETYGSVGSGSATLVSTLPFKVVSRRHWLKIEELEMFL